MDESADKSLDKNDNTEIAKHCADGAATRDGETAPVPTAPSADTENKLPVVWSPKLDAADDIEAETTELDPDNLVAPNEEAATDEAAPEQADAAAASPPRTRRFALLAATLAVAAGLGSFIGTLTASGVGRLLPQTAIVSSNTEDGAVTKALQAQLTALSNLKAALDGAVRNTTTQFAALGDRLDRVEHAQADATARLSKLDAAPETTGSIGSSTATATEPKLTDRILQDWVVHDVRGDRALVESRYGGLFDVGAGSVLPGVGRVDGVKRQDGEWVVVTARGVITSGR